MRTSRVPSQKERAERSSPNPNAMRVPGMRSPVGKVVTRAQGATPPCRTRIGCERAASASSARACASLATKGAWEGGAPPPFPFGPRPVATPVREPMASGAQYAQQPRSVQEYLAARLGAIEAAASAGARRPEAMRRSADCFQHGGAHAAVQTLSAELAAHVGQHGHAGMHAGTYSHPQVRAYPPRSYAAVGEPGWATAQNAVGGAEGSQRPSHTFDHTQSSGERHQAALASMLEEERARLEEQRRSLQERERAQELEAALRQREAPLSARVVARRAVRSVAMGDAQAGLGQARMRFDENEADELVVAQMQHVESLVDSFQQQTVDERARRQVFEQDWEEKVRARLRMACALARTR